MPLGFRPSEDPDWRHEHVPTGEVRQCSREGCTATWPVLCHSGHRRVCDVCARAIKRERDRAAKRRIRAQERRNREIEQREREKRRASAAKFAADVALGLYEHDARKAHRDEMRRLNDAIAASSAKG